MCNTPSLNNSNKILSKQRLCVKRQFLGVQEGVWAWQQLGRRRREAPRGSGPTVPRAVPRGQGLRLPDSADMLPPLLPQPHTMWQGLPGALLRTYCALSPGLRLCLDGLSGATQQAWETRLSPVHKSQDRGLSARKQQSRPQHSRLASGPPPEETRPAAGGETARLSPPSLGSEAPSDQPFRRVLSGHYLVSRSWASEQQFFLF